MRSLSSKPIRCGVIGVGYLGAHHARVYHELPQCELIGVCDANIERAREIAALHNCKVFDTAEQLGTACEAVSVAVSTDKHADVAVPLLRAGCHLLVEKPICSSLQQAERILQAANEHGRIVQIGHIEHYNPVTKFLEQQVSEPRYIVAERLAPFNPRGTEVGVVLDLMIHDIGIIMKLVRSPIVRVDAVGVNVLSARDEDIANARLVFENGCVANLNASRVSLKKVREIRVFQPSAYLSLDFMNQSGHLLRKVGMALDKQDIPIEKAEPLVVEISAFAECVRERSEPKVCAAFGKSALEVAIQIADQIRANIQNYTRCK